MSPWPPTLASPVGNVNGAVGPTTTSDGRNSFILFGAITETAGEVGPIKIFSLLVVRKLKRSSLKPAPSLVGSIQRRFGQVRRRATYLRIWLPRLRSRSRRYPLGLHHHRHPPRARCRDPPGAIRRWGSTDRVGDQLPAALAIKGAERVAIFHHEGGASRGWVIIVILEDVSNEVIVCS